MLNLSFFISFDVSNTFNCIFSVESFDVFCFGQLLYEMSIGKPLHYGVSSSATNNVINTSYNTAVIEDRNSLPHQLPDSLSTIPCSYFEYMKRFLYKFYFFIP